MIKKSCYSLDARYERFTVFYHGENSEALRLYERLAVITSRARLVESTCVVACAPIISGNYTGDNDEGRSSANRGNSRARAYRRSLLDASVVRIDRFGRVTHIAQSSPVYNKSLRRRDNRDDSMKNEIRQLMKRVSRSAVRNSMGQVWIFLGSSDEFVAQDNIRYLYTYFCVI